ncbi:MAG: GAF and ANTAR domain-containing protein [Ilumatobacteraceae bacterium]
MQDHLRVVVVEFTHALLEPYDLAELLHRVTEHAVRVTQGVGAGIMLWNGSDLEFAAASSDAVTAAERFQGRVEEGVCHDAFTTNRTLVVDDLGATDQWPNYTTRARELGFEAVIGVPLNVHRTTIGVLNVYRDTPRAWSHQDIESCEILAAMAAGYVLYASALQNQTQLSGQLQHALESRAVIEQAKGVLMAREQIDGETAFKRLREASMNANRRLRDIAHEIVAAASGG